MIRLLPLVGLLVLPVNGVAASASGPAPLPLPDRPVGPEPAQVAATQVALAQACAAWIRPVPTGRVASPPLSAGDQDAAQLCRVALHARGLSHLLNCMGAALLWAAVATLVLGALLLWKLVGGLITISGWLSRRLRRAPLRAGVSP